MRSMQRFRSSSPCPVCGGYDEAPRGHGQRCYGFLAEDGRYAHCTREKYAGGLLLEPESQTYAHRLVGDCHCGVRHDPRAPQPPGQAERRIVARYSYRDEQGQLLYEVVRYEPKTFRQRRPDGYGQGGWLWNLNGTRRVLYRLPQLIEAVKAGRTIFLPEGEKDVDVLVKLGLNATTNSGGAKKFPAEQAKHLTGLDVVVLEDNDEQGRQHTEDLYRKLSPVVKSFKRLAFPDLPKGGDVSDWLKHGHNLEELLSLALKAPTYEPDSTAQSDVQENPWAHIKSAPAFLAEPEAPFEGLAKDLLAPGAITIISAPKGLGKTQVALNLGVSLATAGIFRGEPVKSVRVLVLDRDNPEPILKQRLRNWGASTAEKLHVLTRQHAPDLKDHDAWTQFPLESYDVLIIDAVGSFTEGITEKEGRLTSEVLATLLDLARRGIAILLLMNVTKDGLNFRGRGEWTDRVDIHYEVRDATGFTPSGKREWWRELPPAGESEWADRAARRKGKVTFRLAFIPNKFRLGMEPDPFCLELHLPPEGLWTLKDVTASLIAAGEEAVQAAAEAKQAQQDKAVQTLADLVDQRHGQGNPLTKKDAEEFLRDQDIGRNEARNLIEMYAGVKWWVSDERRGVPHTLLPLTSGEVARFGDPAKDAASQPSEPRQPGPQGSEVMASENPPQERPPEPSPPRQQISDNTCATHGEGGMVPENGRWICGICLGMPMERIELLRQRERRNGPTGEG